MYRALKEFVIQEYVIMIVSDSLQLLRTLERTVMVNQISVVGESLQTYQRDGLLDFSS